MVKESVLLILLFFAQCLPVYSAPSIIAGRPEPSEPAGLTLEERFSAGAPRGMMLAPASYPTRTVNILFLRVEFQPEPSPSAVETTGTGLWNDTLYAEGTVTDGNDLNDRAFNFWVNRAKTQVVKYWREVSYGLLPLAVTISPKVYRLPRTMVFYGGESAGAIESFIYDAIQSAEADASPDRIDFSSYDALFIVHAGCGQESDAREDTPGDLWSLYYRSSCISPNGTAGGCLGTSLRDGKPISEAIIMAQTDTQDGATIDPFGVYVHEFGHWLGLPDLYCTEATSLCARGGVGKWSLMGDGVFNRVPFTSSLPGSFPAHPDAWSMVRLGWIVPEEITTETFVALAPTESLLPPPAPPVPGANVIKAQASTATSRQYVLLENRQQFGYDAGLPGHGLLVWLVDQDVIDEKIAGNAINTDRSRPGLHLIEADNDWMTDSGSDRDPYPGSMGNTLLTPLTTPSSIPRTDYGWVNIKNIAETVGPTVDFTIGFAPLPPQDIAVDRDRGTITWTPSDGAVLYRVYKNFHYSTPYASLGAQTAYTDASYQRDDCYEIAAVDSSGNVSHPAEIRPVLSANPDLLRFSDSTSRSLVIINTGSADFLLQSITITGTNAPDYKALNNCPDTITVGGSCVITVTFSATSEGVSNALLTLTSRKGGIPQVNIPLTTAPESASLVGGGTSVVTTVVQQVGKGNKACFIATAAYGSYLDPHVEALRNFRDRYLVTNRPGRAFIALYYRYSPPLADFIGDHDVLRTATRWALTPMVLTVEYPAQVLLILMIAALCIAGTAAGTAEGRQKKQKWTL